MCDAEAGLSRIFSSRAPPRRETTRLVKRETLFSFFALLILARATFTHNTHTRGAVSKHHSTIQTSLLIERLRSIQTGFRLLLRSGGVKPKASLDLRIIAGT